jgi:hypothetical protein
MAATIPVFQDVVLGWGAAVRAREGVTLANEDEHDEDDLQTRLFELANAPAVTYRCRGGLPLTIRQDREAKVHTGGIVWETAFLLGLFLEHQPALILADRAPKTPHYVLEVGAGCGLLGMVLAAAGCDVVLTEHPIALANLRHNVTSCGGAIVANRARVAELNWCEANDVRAVRGAQTARGLPPTFDTIVGTDVVFSEQLVVPLLRSVHALATDTTTVWLCLQVRAEDDGYARRLLSARGQLARAASSRTAVTHPSRVCDCARLFTLAGAMRCLPPAVAGQYPGVFRVHRNH